MQNFQGFSYEPKHIVEFSNMHFCVFKCLISKGANYFENETNTDVYVSTFTTLKRASKLLDAKHLVANMSW